MKLRDPLNTEWKEVGKGHRSKEVNRRMRNLTRKLDANRKKAVYDLVTPIDGVVPSPEKLEREWIPVPKLSKRHETDEEMFSRLINEMTDEELYEYKHKVGLLASLETSLFLLDKMEQQKRLNPLISAT